MAKFIQQKFLHQHTFSSSLTKIVPTSNFLFVFWPDTSTRGIVKQDSKQTTRQDRTHVLIW